MFVDEFKLKKDSWYAKMMKYIWNLNTYDFSHTCPLLWLSILNVIIILPVFLFKSAFLKLIYMVFDYSDKKQQKNRDILTAQVRTIMLDIEDNQYYIKLYAQWKLNDYTFEKCVSKLDQAVLQAIYNLYDRGDNNTSNSLFTSILMNEVSLAEFYKKKREEERLKQIARKERINKIVKIAKPLGFILLIILIAIVTLFVGWGIYWCIIHANWMKVGEIVLKVFILVAIIFLVGFIIIKLPEIKPCYKMKILKGIAKPFIWLGRGIGTIFSIIFQMIKNNCPAIKWE